MLRVYLSVMLAALLVLAGAGTAAAGPVPSPGSGLLTVSGRLEYVTNLSAPHYEVAGYVLHFHDQVMMASLSGQTVVVVGTPANEPSIYMRKGIAVESLIATAEYTPPSKPDDGKVTLPIIKEPAAPTPPPTAAAPEAVPANPPVDGATAPVPDPVQLFGTPYYILFGVVEARDGAYLLAQDTVAGPVRIPIRSNGVDLTALTGQRVGLIAARDPGIPGTYRYEVLAAVVLTEDVSAKLKLGSIYSTPERPITIRLNGQEVTMDQRPILGNGRTLVPLRAIGEALGARVAWDPASQTATVALGAREVRVNVGSNRVVVAEPGVPDMVIYCDIAPVIAGGRTMVPVRVISESLGLKVGWDDATRTVTLN